MKKAKFDSKAYWNEIENAVEQGAVKSIRNLAQAKKNLAASARMQREKTKLVSIRVRERDLARLRESAAREGIPYQTLINSLIHKHVLKN